MIADDFVMVPVIFGTRPAPGPAPLGAGAKEFMRSNYRHVMRVFAPVQEIPNPDARVMLDPRVRDCWGIPVARLSGTVHDETVRTARFMREKATEWLDASGAVRTWSDPIVPRISGGQHQAGTCRMGSDARTSVTDQYGRVWGHTNLFIGLIASRNERRFQSGADDPGPLLPQWRAHRASPCRWVRPSP